MDLLGRNFLLFMTSWCNPPTLWLGGRDVSWLMMSVDGCTVTQQLCSHLSLLEPSTALRRGFDWWVALCCRKRVPCSGSLEPCLMALCLGGRNPTWCPYLPQVPGGPLSLSWDMTQTAGQLCHSRSSSCSGSCSKSVAFRVLRQMSQGSVSKRNIPSLQNPKMFSKHCDSF